MPSILMNIQESAPCRSISCRLKVVIHQQTGWQGMVRQCREKLLRRAAISAF